MIEIVLSREDANSESALLVEWLIDDRQRVNTGQPVCVIETSKSAIEIESPGEGTLCQLAREGEEVELGGRIAVIAASAQELSEVDRLSRAPATPVRSEPGRATRKAAELAALHGIDLEAIPKVGFITTEDVEAFVAQSQRRGVVEAEPESGLLPGIATEAVSLPASLGRIEATGELDPEFFDQLRRDPEAVRALAPVERLELYRRHGADIGADVQLGERSVIVARRIVLADGVEFGDDSTVTCDQEFCVGALTRFGARLRLGCRRVFVGAGGHFGEDVHIGGGGRGDPQALFVIGDLAYIGAEVFINPCRPVIIGREVFVTMRSMIVTHNIGHSVLEGFENRFAPVVLEDRVQIGLGAVVYAGVRVGRESIVASNSYVVSDIPPGKLAIGVPARVAASARRTLSPSRRDELAASIVGELREQLLLRGHAVQPVESGLGQGFTIGDGEAISHVLFSERFDKSFDVPASAGETVVLALAVDGAAPDGCSVIDLLGRRVHGSGGVVLDTVREFCRKRGIRLEPGPWKYRRGLL